MSDDKTSLRIRIDGIVQGVGFRAFVLREATARRLDGWVRNRIDGSVEALACGTTKDIEALVGACTKGPTGAMVTNVDLFAAEPPQRAGFTLRQTV